LNKAEDSITAEERDRAKKLCYGILYGMGNKALSETLGVSSERAEMFMGEFKAKYKG